MFHCFGVPDASNVPHVPDVSYGVQSIKRLRDKMFGGLIGNNSIKSVLARLAGAGRVPNAFLFAGGDGVGKRQFALKLAKAFVCRNPQNSAACGGCPACRRAGVFAFPKPDDKDGHKNVISSEHPDVGMVVAYNRNILVDAVRDLEREANFRPYEASARIFIIDDAEKMNDAASNALLKTLEEPPPTSYIFLITSRADSLLATIRSRCQVLRFAPVTTGEIEQYLIGEKKMAAGDAGLVSRLANGSIGRAMSIDLKKFLPQRDTMLGVLRAILLESDRPAALRIAEKMNDAANKDNYEENLDILQTLIHDVWLLRLGESEERLVNSDIDADLGMLANAAEADRLADWLREIETMREGLAVNINRKIATDALFMQMAAS